MSPLFQKARDRLATWLNSDNLLPKNYSSNKATSKYVLIGTKTFFFFSVKGKLFLQNYSYLKSLTNPMEQSLYKHLNLKVGLFFNWRSSSFAPNFVSAADEYMAVTSFVNISVHLQMSPIILFNSLKLINFLNSFPMFNSNTY